MPLIDIALYRQSSPAARNILSVRNGLQTDEFMEMNALRTIVDLVQQDLGVAVVPLARNATGPEDSRLRVTPIDDDAAFRSIGLFERERRSHLTSKLRK